MGSGGQRDEDLDYRLGGFGEQGAGHDGFREEGGYEGLYRDEAGYSQDPGYPEEAGYSQDPAYPQRAGHPEEAGYPPAAGPAALDDEHEPHLFGQIAIYTLLEDRVDDFDRLTRRVVRQVRAQEPHTLVYIMHAVPSAPMQRILYEVYPDRAADQAPKRQPSVIEVGADPRAAPLAAAL